MQTSTKVVVVCLGIWRAVTRRLSACQSIAVTPGMSSMGSDTDVPVPAASVRVANRKGLVLSRQATKCHGARSRSSSALPQNWEQKAIVQSKLQPWIMCSYGWNSTGILWHMQWAGRDPHLLLQPVVLSGESTGTPGNSWEASPSALSASSP